MSLIKVFDSAIHSFVLAFIAEEEYTNYMNNTQKKLKLREKVIKICILMKL